MKRFVAALTPRQWLSVLAALPLSLGTALPLRAEETPASSPTTEQAAAVKEIEIKAAEAVAYFKGERPTLEPKANASKETAPRPIVLDVRTADEFAAGHVPGAKNIDFLTEDFKAQLAKLDKTQPYLVHCAAGGRSSRAIAVLKAMGFQRLYHMKDGFNGWKEAGGPVEGKPTPP